jgi:Holliday junction DNA helicase RuvA
MIASLKGEVAAKSENDLVVLVGDVGFKVMVPKAISAQAIIGERIHLLTNLVVREDSLTLFGFNTEEERDLFNKLLSISGVGPKTALSILSTLSVEMIISAALGNRDEIFCQVPGIGKKSAQKIVIYLHDKVSQMIGKDILTAYKDINAEVVDALIGLGYSAVEAQSAVQSIPKDTPQDLENRLRIALQYFST